MRVRFFTKSPQTGQASVAKPGGILHFFEKTHEKKRCPGMAAKLKMRGWLHFCGGKRGEARGHTRAPALESVYRHGFFVQTGSSCLCLFRRAPARSSPSEPATICPPWRGGPARLSAPGRNIPGAALCASGKPQARAALRHGRGQDAWGLSRLKSTPG